MIHQSPALGVLGNQNRILDMAKSEGSFWEYGMAIRECYAEHKAGVLVWISPKIPDEV